MVKLTKAQEAERQEIIKYLRSMLKAGDTVYTNLNHVSRSGMMRHISVSIIKDNARINISGYVAKALQYTRANDGSLKVGGCGMDMGFHIVYCLSRTLFPNGFECIGEGDVNKWGSRCPSNDHTNGDRDYKPHNHSDGGYALRHQWL